MALHCKRKPRIFNVHSVSDCVLLMVVAVVTEDESLSSTYVTEANQGDQRGCCGQSAKRAHANSVENGSVIEA